MKNLVKTKLDQFLDENNQVKIKSDLISSQLTLTNPKIIEKLEKNSQILSQENVAFKSKPDQLPKQIHSIMLNSLLVNKIKKAKIDKKIPILNSSCIVIWE